MFDTVFGCDPELFLLDNIFGCVPPAALRADYGLKFRGKTIVSGSDWRLIEDGAATEINIAPSADVNEFYDRIETAKNAATKLASDLGLRALVFPRVIFNVKKFWEERDDTFRDCVRFGCDPDLDIYSGKYATEISASNIPERYGGGHIHMQAPEDNPSIYEENYYHITRLMDILVGNTSVALLRPNTDWVTAEKSRLKYYGKPGKIRLQEYPDGHKGIEYRTPSNFWIINKNFTNVLLTMMNVVFNLSKKPSDASKLLIAETEHAPKNIITFNIQSSSKMLSYVCDLLVGMKYLSYDQVGEISDLVSPSNRL
jgi:hypothetical protein